MTSDNTVIASGNLATARRTISGILGQFSLLEINDSHALTLLTNAGLPPQALEQPDFPVSLNQELFISQAIVNIISNNTRSPTRAIFETHQYFGIENMGVLGMAMRHAATSLEALTVCLTYPQLTWGHSRMVVRKQNDTAKFTFSMERPQVRGSSEREIDLLVEYCLVLDLVSSVKNIEDIVENREPPLYIHLPFAEPDDWPQLQASLPCPVHFNRPEACFAYPGAFDNNPLPHAKPLLYRSYVAIAEILSKMLAEDVALSERVRRWLWAYSPPLKRGEIAKQLAMSERSLTRRLGGEGTSYAELLAQVQEQRAKNFLRNAALTVSEIGYRLGYADAAAFSRAFSKWSGLSPLKWRRQFV